MKKFNFDKSDFASRYDAARDVNCPVDLLVKLAGDKSRDVRSAVANNLNCPNKLKVKLALYEKNLLERIGVASDSGSPAAVLARLADDEEFDVRYAVAKNIRCPAKVLIKLVRDEFSDVRNAVAGNPNCPSALLAELVLSFRSTVARNMNCPMDVLAKLAEDYEPYVRIDVTKNKNCTAKVLVKLASDDEPEVRYAVARSANCPAGALVMLAADKFHLTRCAVAENTNCPGKLLAKLAKSKIVSVRVAVADNLVCPLELLEKLAGDSSSNVRYAVADNPNCTLELMKKALAGNHASRKAISDRQPLKLPKQLVRLRKRIESTVKPFVSMRKFGGDKLPDEFILGSLRERTFEKKLRLWQSKVGGFPYLPKDHEYPTDPNGCPLLLQVQINFADVPKLDMYPDKGILQIYLGNADGFPYGLNLADGMDQSYFRVLYFPEVIYDKDALVTDFEFLPIDRSGLPCSDIAPIEFDLKYGPISKGDYRFDQLLLGGSDDNEAYEITEAYPEKFSGYGSKLGGYPEFVQGDPRESYQCFPSIKLDRGTWKMDMDKIGWQGKASDFEFILLLQLDDGFGFEWGSGGIGNFFIRKADLLKPDFSKVLYDWSCM